MVQLSLWRELGLNHPGSICGEITFFSSIMELLSLGYGQLVQSDCEICSFSSHKEYVFGS
jgi:hypothetical protein